MDLKEVKKIIDLVEKSNISGLAVEKDGFKVEVRKELSAPVQPAHTAPFAPPAHIETTEESKKPTNKELTPVTSPMVGTFYAASNPDEEPFVKIGDHISKGQAICIIEAMKLFNEIESEVDGKIEQILVKNSETVEYGQVLMLVRQGS